VIDISMPPNRAFLAGDDRAPKHRGFAFVTIMVRAGADWRVLDGRVMGRRALNVEEERDRAQMRISGRAAE